MPKKNDNSMQAYCKKNGYEYNKKYNVFIDPYQIKSMSKSKRASQIRYMQNKLKNATTETDKDISSWILRLLKKYNK